jgi:hypothetical protein
LKENRNKHLGLLSRAKIGYKKAVIECLESLLKEANDRNFDNLTNILNLPKPVDKAEEYDRAIEMLEMSVDEKITITSQEFRNYVKDKWDWTDQMLLSNTRYADMR